MQAGSRPIFLQLKWHQHCSVVLLSRKHSLTTINLEESAQQSEFSGLIIATKAPCNFLIQAK